MSTPSSATVLHQIGNTLNKLKAEKEQAQHQYEIEKENLTNVERELEELRSQADYMQEVIQEKEEAVNEFSMKIEECEKAYNKLVSNSTELLQAIQQEESNLRNKMRPGANPQKKKDEPAEEEAGEEEEGDDEDGDDN